MILTTIDIRKDSVETIDKIVFYDNCALTLDDDTVDIKCEQGYTQGSYYCVEFKDEAENLIKALQKALELGWFDD